MRKQLVIILSAVGYLFAMTGCMQMPKKIERKKASSSYSNPSKHHPFPPRAKNKANQKH